MIKYLEDKYGMEFSYSGYVPAGLMESEYLIAYPTAEGSGDGVNLVVVEPDGDAFKDNYAREYDAQQSPYSLILRDLSVKP